jgi:hypothetical protein
MEAGFAAYPGVGRTRAGSEQHGRAEVIELSVLQWDTIVRNSSTPQLVIGVNMACHAPSG